MFIHKVLGKQVVQGVMFYLKYDDQFYLYIVSLEFLIRI